MQITTTNYKTQVTKRNSKSKHDKWQNTLTNNKTANGKTQVQIIKYKSSNKTNDKHGNLQSMVKRKTTTNCQSNEQRKNTLQPLARGTGGWHDEYKDEYAKLKSGCIYSKGNLNFQHKW